VEIRDLFSVMTHQATYRRTQASLSLTLSSSSCFFLFTSTVNFYCLLFSVCFYCAYEDIVFPLCQGKMTEPFTSFLVGTA
jgi:hypothetical protein